MASANRQLLGSVLFFSVALSVALLFILWLVVDGDDERIHDAYKEHEHLMALGKTAEAYVLFLDALKAEGEGPLDPIWIPFIRVHGNGYERLTYFIRVLESRPSQEDIYEEIAKVIELAPRSFHLEVKERYLRDVRAIDGINVGYLEKYGLLLAPDESK